MDVLEQMKERLGGPPMPTEDAVTKSIERYRAGIPSSAILAIALGAMLLSILAQLGGRGKWGSFIAQWLPTILMMGVYNKLIKLEGHDQTDRGDGQAVQSRRSRRPTRQDRSRA
jgi:hypothetical protein